MTARRRTLIPVGLATIFLVAIAAPSVVGLVQWSRPSEPIESQPDRSGLDLRAVSCPADARDRSDAEFETLEALLLATSRLDTPQMQDRGSGVYCVAVEAVDAAPDAVRVTIAAPADDSNYGESHSFTDAEGSDELWHFPVAIGVYGGCRTVVATVELRNGSEHTARARIGSRCDRQRATSSG